MRKILKALCITQCLIALALIVAGQIVLPMVFVATAATQWPIED